MSLRALTWAFGVRTPSPGAKLALLALADSADDDGIVILGRKALAKKCQVSPGTSTAHLKALEQAELIWRKDRRRQNGSLTSSWTVLAPGAKDRGQMLDASTEKREDSELLAKACRREHAEDGQVKKLNPKVELTGLENAPGQVKFLGGPPDPSEDPSVKKKKAREDEEEIRRAKRFSKWFVELLTDRRGGIPPRTTDGWLDAAREIVRKRKSDEIVAVITYAVNNGYLYERKANTLPKLAREYPDLRARWVGEQNRRNQNEPTPDPDREARIRASYEVNYG